MIHDCSEHFRCGGLKRGFFSAKQTSPIVNHEFYEVCSWLSQATLLTSFESSSGRDTGDDPVFSQRCCCDSINDMPYR